MAFLEAKRVFSLAEMVWGPFAAGRLVVETTEAIICVCSQTELPRSSPEPRDTGQWCCCPWAHQGGCAEGCGEEVAPGRTEQLEMQFELTKLLGWPGAMRTR